MAPSLHFFYFASSPLLSMIRLYLPRERLSAPRMLFLRPHPIKRAHNPALVSMPQLQTEVKQHLPVQGCFTLAYFVMAFLPSFRKPFQNPRSPPN
ncbi:hypothetical protein BO71DRAFT_56407 [Aspergillus ellipticus CBS 707.79]|uniref:Uncharacterized protein n=1 Tax=Aspergillus ellipticus CBS 707.79 TaxID=1448320 RepID=A0A319D2A0_9EURO|nr:hypothetical protein BO71DRAFT_56407 [Aspergillus ellipticus CBS 707.79]